MEYGKSPLAMLNGKLAKVMIDIEEPSIRLSNDLPPTLLLSLLMQPGGRFACLEESPLIRPSKALVTLNDPVFFDAARALAQLVLDPEKSKEEQLQEMYQRMAGKRPSMKKAAVMLELYEKTTTYYQRHPEEAFEIAQSSQIELAVLTVVANS